MTSHIVIDLETLGIKPGSVIAAIGAVCVDPFDRAVNAKFQMEIGLRASRELGFDIDAGTLAWWMEQVAEKPGLAKLFSENASHPSSVLLKFNRWVKDQSKGGDREIRVWACGPDFDISILRAYYDTLKIDWPFRYSAARDIRTLCDEVGALVGFDRHRDAAPRMRHDPLSDARAEGRALCEVLLRLHQIAGHDCPGSTSRPD